MIATKNVQRKIAVVAVVPVKESPVLVTMNRVIRGVEIQNKPLRWLVKGLEKYIDKQLLDFVYLSSRMQ